ncbi:MAG: hypothetical protein HOV68_05270 [Streptomycetaceae bacterium]|nr:hypothetical protein [Streptomycetaceae bacterium]
MKLPRWRRAAPEGEPGLDLWDDEADDQTLEEAAEDDGAAGGWRTSTAGLSGGARLARGVVWAVIVSGPLLGLAALASSGAAGTPPASIASTAAPGSDTGPAGFAQLYVAAYLGAGQGTEGTLTSYYASPVTLTSPPGMRRAVHLAAVASREVQPGYWSVTVAAQVAVKTQAGAYVDAGTQFFRVGVQTASLPDASGPGAAGYTATSLPAQVAAPAGLQPGALGYGAGRGVEPGPATDTAAAFLTAYLAGQGELTRYTSPEVRLSPITPAPYAQVTVTDVRDDAGGPTDQKVPADGTVRRLLVTVDAADVSGAAYPLTYALQLKARGGRWEVASLDDAPALKPGNAPPSAPPAAPATSGTPTVGAVPSPTRPVGSLPMPTVSPTLIPKE